MTCRRLLLNFGSRSTDLRVGSSAFDELPRLLKGAVSKPRAAFLIAAAGEAPEHVDEVRHSLTDAGYTVHVYAHAGHERLDTLECAQDVLAQVGRAGITAEDLLVGLGNMAVCSLASFCGRLWCAGMPVALIPTTLDAMVCAPTQMQPLSVAPAGAGEAGVPAEGALEEDAPALVSLAPELSLIVCNLDFVCAAPLEANALGYVRMVAASLAESRKHWGAFAEVIEGLRAGQEIAFIDALCAAENARLHTVKSVSPSARRAFIYGETTARALQACLAKQGARPPFYQLLAEGMRFEARMATDATGFSVDDMFCQDDYLEDLGIEELAFELESETFIEALRAERFARANRFQFALPKNPGTIRLTAVDDETLERHARAFLASRAP